MDDGPTGRARAFAAEADDAHAALDLAMGVGGILLAAGMPANDVVVRVLRVVEAYRLRQVQVDVTYTAIAASHCPRPGHPPVTAIRVVRPDVVDYTKVRRLDRLCDEIGAGLPVDQAVATYQRIVAAPHPYPLWVSTGAHAAIGAAVSLLFTTSWKIVLLAFLTGCLIDPLMRLFERRRVPAFFQLAAAAALVTLIAAAVTSAARHRVTFLTGTDPNLVVVGGIVTLAAGMTTVGAAQDAIDQFYVTASARVLEVVTRTAGIVAGIVVALRLVRRLGIQLSISPDQVVLGSPGTQFLAAALIGVAFTLSVYADGFTVLLAGGLGMLGWAGHAAMRGAGAGQVTASAVGAALAALVATLLVRRTDVPGFGLVTAALLPLVPGLSLYNGLLRMVGTLPGGGDASGGARVLLLAFGVALGIAAGASLGTYLGRPILERLGPVCSRWGWPERPQ